MVDLDPLLEWYVCGKVLLSGSSNYFPWKSIWKAKISSKVAFFSWTTAWGHILTMELKLHLSPTMLDWLAALSGHSFSSLEEFLDLHNFD